VDTWAASEALPLGQSCGSGDGLHLSDDLVILEPIDSAGGPAQVGQSSSGALLTNLYNLALPIIRCEIEDRVTLSADPCRCGSAYTLVTEVQGRTRERFVYDGGVVVDPSEIGSVLAREKDVRAYQVRQTDAGAEVRVQSEKPLYLRAVAQRVASALGKGGLDSPSVTVQRVGEIERSPAGKLRRYVPRPATIPPARAESSRESDAGQSLSHGG
jgi:phenylacetate-coenzyme A ligase PaaK-like adenylate-forming protein